LPRGKLYWILQVMFTKPTNCPNSECRFRRGPEGAEKLYGTSRFYTKMGYFRRRSDRRAVPRYRCRSCGKSFSSQTHSPTYRQRRPDVNGIVFRLLCSGVTMRRTALVVGVNKSTIERKMAWLADRARAIHDERLASGGLNTSLVQFDELQTFEHTRLKPVSIAVAIRVKTGEVIDVDVAMMSSFGAMVRRTRELYPEWRETRRGARESVFRSVAKCAKPGVTIKTDESRHYPPIIDRLVPGARIEQHLSPGNDDHPCPDGFDPMFKLNHLFAKMRQDMSRLFRSTWATTKTLAGLYNHLMLYIAWQNRYTIT